MTEFPLVDFVNQFHKDVQAVSTEFQVGRQEATKGVVPQICGNPEGGQSLNSSSSMQSPGVEARSMRQRPEPAIAASPLRTSKQDARATTPPPATAAAPSPLHMPKSLRGAGSRHADLMDHGESVQVGQRPQAAKAPSCPTVATQSVGDKSIGETVKSLASTSPRPGSLQDRMISRGTLPGSVAAALAGTPPNSSLVPVANVVPVERGQRLGSRSSGDSGCADSRMSDERRRPASLDKATVPSCASSSPATSRAISSELPPSSPIASPQHHARQPGLGTASPPSQQPAMQPAAQAKRPREHSMVTLYKEMVDPSLQIAKGSGEMFHATAKKLRRSSMLKKEQQLLEQRVQLARESSVKVVQAPAKIVQAPTSVVPPPTAPSPAVTLAVASPQKKTGGKTKATKAAGGETSQGQAKRLRIQEKGKKTYPPVKPFVSSPRAVKSLNDWQLLMQSPLLSPKKDEDNYEISEKDENSDENCDEEIDRSHKRVPSWCNNYLEMLAVQSSIDPDTIFGSKVPVPDLNVIFGRPGRKRGSSMHWHKDRLKSTEICMYKQKMGHTASWTTTCQKAAKKLINTPAKPLPVGAN